MAAAVLHVCTTCRRGIAADAEVLVCATCPLGPPGSSGGEACAKCRLGSGGEWERMRPGALLMAALSAADSPEGVVIKGVECLSACNTG
ncbi:MAG: hypothetical protein WCC57_08645, partial [Paracoccaceae bacterium]